MEKTLIGLSSKEFLRISLIPKSELQKFVNKTISVSVSVQTLKGEKINFTLESDSSLNLIVLLDLLKLDTIVLVFRQTLSHRVKCVTY